MKPPCEIVVWYVIPAIRSELAKELLNLGMRQKDVSELMDITQPAVSQYITDKRGSGIKLDDNVRKMVKEFAVELAEGKAT
ncbi:MAG: helix-turn-helix domain-containing protein, partial [Methanobrevibacter sp.]|nr:helix-turn-helix domain-containing protein [Methanobrevibacter sp.]